MKRIIRYINSHFLLRNTVIFLCFGLVAVYAISLLLNLFTRHGQQYEVPSMVGLSIPEARERAQAAKLELIVIDSLYIPRQLPGTIIDQSPKANMGVKSGRKVFLTINASRPKTDVVPYVAGFSLRQAKNKLESKGFEIAELIYSTDVATNNVISQNIRGKNIAQGSNFEAELGTAVTLVVGRESDAPLPMVPKIVGLTLREAKSRLWEVGLNMGEIKYDYELKEDEYDIAKIYSQSPAQESRADYGSRVAVRLSGSIDKVTKASAEADAKARYTKPTEQQEEIEEIE